MMKKCTIYSILILLLFQNAGSLWIIGDFYINQDYIAKNLCINRFDAVPLCKGRCYLAKELKGAEKQQQKIPAVTYKEVQLFFEKAVLSMPDAPADRIRKTFPSLIISRIREIFIFSIYHPPRCA